MFLGDLYGLANFVESLIIYFPFLDNDNQQTVFWIFFGVALFGFVIGVRMRSCLSFACECLSPQRVSQLAYDAVFGLLCYYCRFDLPVVTRRCGGG